MKLYIRAWGKIKSPALKDLCTSYQKRITYPLEIIEVPSTPAKKASLGPLQDRCPHSLTYLLDEHGKNLSSLEWAHLIDQGHQKSLKSMSFLIGDAYGFDAQTLENCHQRLAFGAQTWPHDLVRLLLLEQIYRAQQILSNHPYHKQG